ncbi:MAG TPA: indole-3-glycerol phosphate synthase TrpC [Candidatus Avacidaminococcus intestinavium]|uniref:Indole-3-glycerol phosphate synthase n=1 Tax=Candidatus Avacidaminococcus intestinavium TaxID=2840684 RepID=A0A9D1MPZ4_9FIRM|nr:indole-3-glycerol phosphate synthase TrpC [Candidatus Avacidaminococcus intestinavium]
MILDELAFASAKRVLVAKSQKPLAVIKKEARSLPKGNFVFEQAISKKGLSFISEIKKASPSKGLIMNSFQPEKLAEKYVAAGSSAISVLTEPTRFLGNDEYLRRVKQVVPVPVLRKDFTVDEYQIFEAKILGADAVLLICTLLTEWQIREYVGLCDELGISALVEAHNQKEVEQALRAGARIIGVNNRNLKDFSVDLSNSVRLRSVVPPEVIFVAESGITTAEDIKTLVANKVDAVLIGETLMRSANIRETMNKLRGGLVAT